MKGSSSIARFLKHSGIYAIGNIVNRLGAFLLLPVYTQHLSVEDYGALELFYGFSAIVFGIVSIGIAHATLRFFFEYDEESERKQVISSGYIFALLISIITCIIVSPFSEKINLLLFQEIRYQYAIYLVLLTIVFELTSQVCLAYIRAIEKSLMFVYISVLKLVVQVSINATLVLAFHGNVEEILLGNLLAVVLSWLVLTVFTLHHNGFAFNYQIIKRILNYSYPFLFGTLLSIVASNFDKFSLNYLNAIGAVGIYMLAFKFAQVIESLIGEPFNRSYGSYRFSIMKDPQAPNIQAKIFNYLSFTIIMMSLGLSLVIDNLLKVMSNVEYLSAAIYTPMVLVGTIFKVLAYPLQTGILYEKKTGNLFYISLTSLVVNIVANLLFIPTIGIAGACIAFMLSEFTNALLTGLISQRYFRVAYNFKPPLILMVIATATFLLNDLMSIDDNLTDLSVNLASYGLIIVAIFKTNLFLSDEELAAIKTRLDGIMGPGKVHKQNV